MRILVIDDDVTQVEFLAHFLRKEGHEVLTATSPALALIATHKASPDAVVADLYLGGPDGVDLCERMRAMGAIGDVPFVIISGSDSAADERRARQAGALAYLVKPLEPQILCAVIDGLTRH